MSRAQENIKVDPKEVLFAQVQTDCIEVEAGSGLDDLYWTFSSSTEDYYVWYNVDAGGTDPALAGKTAIEVAILSTDSAAQVATKVVAAINAEAGLYSLIDPKKSTRVILKVLEYAEGTPAAAGDVTGHVFTPVHAGFFHDWGFTEGDIEPSLDQQILSITSHQTGTEELTSIITGMVVELPITFKELSQDNLDRLIKMTSGGAVTPSGGSELIGFGSGQNFDNIIDKAARLILHPARLPQSDRSEDYCIWLAYPKIDSLSFSGESEQRVSVTFKAYRDDFVHSSVDKIAKGDHLQY